MAQSYGGVRWRDRDRFRFNGWNGIDNIISSGGNIGDAPIPPTSSSIVTEDGKIIVTESGDTVVTEP